MTERRPEPAEDVRQKQLGDIPVGIELPRLLADQQGGPHPWVDGRMHDSVGLEVVEELRGEPDQLVGFLRRRPLSAPISTTTATGRRSTTR